MNDIKYIAHHGIKGQKWYVRRYQNEDGTLTEEGKKRYYSKEGEFREKKFSRDTVKSLNKAEKYRADYDIKLHSYDDSEFNKASMHMSRGLIEKNLKKYKNDINKILNLAKTKSINIDTEETVRKVRNLMQQEHNTFYNIMMMTLMPQYQLAGLVAKSLDTTKVESTKYKLKK